MIPISKPVFDAKEFDAVQKILESGHIAAGQETVLFEKEFADYLGAGASSATSSGTTALHLACLAVGLQKGDEVITTSFSFIASANAIAFTGATPVFIDINTSFNMDPQLIERAITPRTKAILVVHLYGKPADMKYICEIAGRHNLKVIEDACQAHGAHIDGKKVGTWGDVGCFSFYATKNMTAAEGGMVVSDDTECIKHVSILKNHGSTVRYYHDTLGYNFRMTDINAALGRVQLTKLDTFNEKRRENARYLNASLKNLSGIILPDVSDKGHVFHQYSILIQPPYNRDQVQKSLTEKGVGTGVFYPVPIHRQKVYASLQVSLPVVERISSQILSLPIHPGLTTKDLDVITDKLTEVFI